MELKYSQHPFFKESHHVTWRQKWDFSSTGPSLTRLEFCELCFKHDQTKGVFLGNFVVFLIGGDDCFFLLQWSFSYIRSAMAILPQMLACGGRSHEHSEQVDTNIVLTGRFDKNKRNPPQRRCPDICQFRISWLPGMNIFQKYFKSG